MSVFFTTFTTIRFLALRFTLAVCVVCLFFVFVFLNILYAKVLMEQGAWYELTTRHGLASSKYISNLNSHDTAGLGMIRPTVHWAYKKKPNCDSGVQVRDEFRGCLSSSLLTTLSVVT